MNGPRLLVAVCSLVGALHVDAGWAADSTAGPSWASLTLVQRQTLAPLQGDWDSIDANRKQKWVELSARFAALPPEERQRVQARMSDWARLTPAERARARLQFQEAQQLPSGERQERWKAYQALSPDERKTLAQRAVPAAPQPGSAPARGVPASPAVLADGSSRSRAAVDSGVSGNVSNVMGNGKRNLVAPSAPVPSRVVTPATTPMLVQARPGATTTSMTLRTAPPSHNQAGLPKIAATPDYVDRNTLLPRRGPQGAAVRSAASADPAEQP